jgi:hypothetical protein
MKSWPKATSIQALLNPSFLRSHMQQLSVFGIPICKEFQFWFLIPHVAQSKLHLSVYDISIEILECLLQFGYFRSRFLRRGGILAREFCNALSNYLQYNGTIRPALGILIYTENPIPFYNSGFAIRKTP